MSIMLFLNFLVSIHLLYILESICVQSWLSVPPAPAFISIKQSLPSASPESKVLIRNSFDNLVVFFRRVFISASTSSSVSDLNSLYRSFKSLISNSNLFIWAIKHSNFLFFLNISCALSTLFHKSLFSDNCLSSFIFLSKCSGSKIPPNRF